jgi:hypothetical protein
MKGVGLKGVRARSIIPIGGVNKTEIGRRPIIVVEILP